MTKSPHLESLRDATAMVGSADQKRLSLDLNEVLDRSPVAGTAVRLNALWQDSGVPGRDVVRNKSWGLSPSLALGLGTPTRFTVAASYTQQKNLPDSGMPIVAVPGGAVLPDTVPALTQSVRQENFYGLSQGDFEHVTAKGVTARLEHDFTPDLKLSNQTRWAQTERDALNTYVQNNNITPTTFAATTTPINPATGTVPPAYTSYAPSTATVTPRRIRTDTDNEVLSNQTNLTAKFETGSVQHTMAAGVEFSREKQTAPTWQGVAGPGTHLYSPDPSRGVTIEQIPYRASNRPFAQGQTDTASLYAFDTIILMEALLFNLSARWDHYKTDYTSLAPATLAAANPVRELIGVDGDLLSWKAGLVYKLRKNGSLYAAYGNSFTPAGTGFALSTATGNQNNPSLDPQETRNLEIGTKWNFFHERFSASLALYRTKNLNGASTDLVTGLITQDISQTVEGIELGLSGKITEKWLLFGGFGTIDSRYEAAGTTAAINDGALLRYTPRLSGNLWTTYALGHGLTIGGGVQYSASTVRSTAAVITSTSPSLSAVPGYWIWNAMLAYEVSPHLSVRLNLNNLTDETYFRLNNNGGRYYPGTPRSFSLTADLKF